MSGEGRRFRQACEIVRRGAAARVLLQLLPLSHEGAAPARLGLVAGSPQFGEALPRRRGRACWLPVIQAGSTWPAAPAAFPQAGAKLSAPTRVRRTDTDPPALRIPDPGSLIATPDDG